VSVKGVAGGNKRTVAAGRWDNRRCVSISEQMQGCTKQFGDGPPRYSERTTISASCRFSASAIRGRRDPPLCRIF
jgi:hypothetical protein